MLSFITFEYFVSLQKEVSTYHVFVFQKVCMSQKFKCFRHTLASKTFLKKRAHVVMASKQLFSQAFA